MLVLTGAERVASMTEEKHTDSRQDGVADAAHAGRAPFCDQSGHADPTTNGSARVAPTPAHDHAHGNMHHAHEHSADRSGHDHHHHSGGHHHHTEDVDTQRLLIAFGVIAVFTIVEVVGGIISGSLALLADSGHMLTDAAALGIALWARRLARAPISTSFPYGQRRAQVLAAFVNSVALFPLIIFLVVESIGRMASPTTINAPVMLGVAALGLMANLIAFRALHPAANRDVNMRGAMLHVVSDMLGSVAAIVAGLLIFLSPRFSIVDPLVTIAVCVLIARSAWSLFRETTRVLLQGAPANIDHAEIARRIRDAAPNVVDVHNLRLWMLTPETVLATMHVRVDDPGVADTALTAIKKMLIDRYGIADTTIQVECRAAPDPRMATAGQTVSYLCPDDDVARTVRIGRVGHAH